MTILLKLFEHIDGKTYCKCTVIDKNNNESIYIGTGWNWYNTETGEKANLKIKLHLWLIEKSIK